MKAATGLRENEAPAVVWRTPDEWRRELAARRARLRAEERRRRGRRPWLVALLRVVLVEGERAAQRAEQRAERERR